MQMIDVLKRLAELDAGNPNIIKENQQVEECGMGMMPEMGMPMERPPTPATINMTAGSAAELGDLLKDIVSLAGMKDPGQDTVSAAPAIDNTPPAAAGTLEPAGGPDDAIGSMRSMIDKLNPMDGDDEGPKEVGAGSDNDGVSKAQGDVDGDGDHDMNDHNLEKGSGDDKDKEEVDEYDNTPNHPVKDVDEFDPDQHAHQENQPGQGDRMDGDRPKAYADMNEAVADLFAQYKKFVKES